MKLEIGHHSHYEIREERCQGKGTRAWKLVYLSDFHFNSYSGPIVNALIQTVQDLQPDVVLLGGDYVDTASGYPFLELFLSSFSQQIPVFAIAGNHDRWSGFNSIKKLMLDHHVHWIDQSFADIELAGHKIRVDGQPFPEAISPADFRILCLHAPVTLSDANNPYDLVLAGHLHGGQVVWWQNEKGLYPARWFYRHNFLRKQSGNCLYLVSKGLGDTLPLRYNCPKDLLFLNFEERK